MMNKKLILISALLFSFNGWANEDKVIRLSCKCVRVEDTGSSRLPCIVSKTISSVIIDRKHGVMIFDGEESNMDWDDEYYYGQPYTFGFSDKTRWGVKLNRTTLWLSKRNKNIRYKPNGYSCKVVEGI